MAKNGKLPCKICAINMLPLCPTVQVNLDRYFACSFASFFLTLEAIAKLFIKTKTGFLIKKYFVFIKAYAETNSGIHDRLSEN